jgi:nucleotide-binding universal stress UspA family protein
LSGFWDRRTLEPSGSEDPQSPQEFEMLSQSGRIVAGYDGSESAGTALDWAAAEAQRRRVPLTVLHVLDYVEVAPGPLEVTPWPDLSAETIGQVAAEGAARARKTADSIEVTAVVEHGQVARTLIDAAHDADLVVVGTRSHGPLGAAMLGSVSLAVSTHANCPTVVVRGDSSQLPGPQRPVVVGVDDSPGADVALHFAADVATQTGARLIVVSGYQPALLQVWTGVSSTTIDPEPDPGYVADSRSAAEKVVAAAAETARTTHPGLEITEQVRQGPAAAVIAAATHRAGLAVVGSRGRGGFSGLMVGSVSHRVLHTALCPVAVVRQTGSAAPAG